MHCSLCRKQPGTIALKHVVNGETRDLQVCQACAAKHGLEAQLPIPLLTDMLLGDAAGRAVAGDDQVCTTCHMHQTDFHKTSLLGCPACYAAFAGEIDTLVRTMHKDVRHLGKVPRGRAPGYLRSLERAIAEADPAREGATIDRLRRHLRKMVRPPAGRATRESTVTGVEPEMTAD